MIVFEGLLYFTQSIYLQHYWDFHQLAEPFELLRSFLCSSVFSYKLLLDFEILFGTKNF